MVLLTQCHTFRAVFQMCSEMRFFIICHCRLHIMVLDGWPDLQPTVPAELRICKTQVNYSKCAFVLDFRMPVVIYINYIYTVSLLSIIDPCFPQRFPADHYFIMNGLIHFIYGTYSNANKSIQW